jgi:hypothetical protein
MHQVVASQFAAEDHENCHHHQKDDDVVGERLRGVGNKFPHIATNM